VDRGLLNLTDIYFSAVYEEDTNIVLYTNKILQLFTVDYKEPEDLYFKDS
jgi:hypothetical protein